MFSDTALLKLSARIVELGEESSANRQLLRDLHKKQGVLNRKIKSKERENVELEKDAIDIQVLRFGQEINMDSFAQMRDSNEVIELQAKVKRAEAQHEAKLQRLQRCDFFPFFSVFLVTSASFMYDCVLETFFLLLLLLLLRSRCGFFFSPPWNLSTLDCHL